MSERADHRDRRDRLDLKASEDRPANREREDRPANRDRRDLEDRPDSRVPTDTREASSSSTRRSAKRGFSLASPIDDDALRRLVVAAPIPDRLLRNLERAPIVDTAKLRTFRVVNPTLTPALLAVLERVAVGRTNPQIAADLGISLEAARDRVKRLLRLYDARNRTHLAALAIRAGDV